MRRQLLLPALLATCILVAAAVIYTWLPVRTHWSDIFRPAALELLQGRSPYTVQHFFNPPWALLAIIPFALLPESIGNALLGAITLVAFGCVAVKLGARPIVLLLFLTQPLVLYHAVQVNVDWLVAIGLVLPPQIGLFFVLVKPQLGVFVALCWLVGAWRNGGIRSAAVTFGPVLLAFALSMVVFGNYFSSALIVFDDPRFSFWPSSIAFGLPVLVLALRWSQPALALAAAVLLTPYVEPYSIPLAAFGLLHTQQLAIAWLLGSWFMFLDPTRWYVLRRLIQPAGP